MGDSVPKVTYTAELETPVRDVMANNLLKTCRNYINVHMSLSLPEIYSNLSKSD